MQGCKSDTKTLNLGTPQGGVLSPTLFNVLMLPLADMKLPKNSTVIAYADGVSFRAKRITTSKPSSIIWGKICDLLWLEIIQRKNESHPHRVWKTRGTSSQGFPSWIRETLHIYRYYVGAGTKLVNLEWVRVPNFCQERLRPMRNLTWRIVSGGSSMSVLRQMYIVFIRPIIDYAASTCINLGKTRIKKMEVVQNKALRTTLRGA